MKDERKRKEEKGRVGWIGKGREGRIGLIDAVGDAVAVRR